jgi:hypothetical protein
MVAVEGIEPSVFTLWVDGLQPSAVAAEATPPNELFENRCRALVDVLASVAGAPHDVVAGALDREKRKDKREEVEHGSLLGEVELPYLALVHPEGVEPSTNRLRVCCSTD